MTLHILRKLTERSFFNYLDTSVDTILNFHRSGGSVSWYNNLFLGEDVFEEVGWSKHFWTTKS